MHLTPIGWIALPLGVVLGTCSPRLLYPLTVFFLPFTATAVANVGSGDNASGIQIAMYFGSLWMVMEFSKLWQRRLSGYFHPRVAQLMVFTALVFVSLLVPVWINGRVVVETANYSGVDSAPLQFTAKHITQTLYLVYGVAFAILVACKNVDLREFARSLRMFLVSCTFVSFWGLLQFACFFLGIPYPAAIFNTSQTESALGYTQQLLGVQRVSSVATEPSILAECLLLGLLIALFAVASRWPVISHKWDRIALGSILLVLLLSTSATAYAGLAVIAVLYLVVLRSAGMLSPKRVAIAAAAAAVLAAWLYRTYTASDLLRNLVESQLISKGETYSALERLNSILLARDYFFQHPWLGLGWGSVVSHDLVFKLLSNVGIFGFLSFAVFLGSVLLYAAKASRVREHHRFPLGWWTQCIFLMLLLTVLINITNGFSFMFGHFWFVIGLGMCVPALRMYEAAGKPVQIRQTVA